jgi:hypothetical protein
MESPARKQRKITNEQIDQNKPAFLIIDRCGGLTKFCEDFSYSASTVYGWLESGLIPAKMRQTPKGELSHQAWILVRARELGVVIEPMDFIERVAQP